MTSEHDWRRRWVCIHCGKHSPVPLINFEHEQRCPLNPEGERT